MPVKTKTPVGNILSIDIGGTNIKACILNKNGKLLWVDQHIDQDIINLAKENNITVITDRDISKELIRIRQGKSNS